MSLFSLHPSHPNGQMVCFDRCTKKITQTIIIVIFCECAIVFSMLSVAVGLCTCFFASPKNFLSLHITSHTLYNKYKLLKIVCTLIVVSKSL